MMDEWNGSLREIKKISFFKMNEKNEQFHWTNGFTEQTK